MLSVVYKVCNKLNTELSADLGGGGSGLPTPMENLSKSHTKFTPKNYPYDPPQKKLIRA